MKTDMDFWTLLQYRVIISKIIFYGAVLCGHVIISTDIITAPGEASVHREACRV
jgi:hypothetical protein